MMQCYLSILNALFLNVELHGITRYGVLNILTIIFHEWVSQPQQADTACSIAAAAPAAIPAPKESIEDVLVKRRLQPKAINRP